MKKRLFLLLLFLSGLTVRAQEISFERPDRRLGALDRGSRTRMRFVFENTGRAPLVIHEIVTTCGCTRPRFSRRPVLPGQRDSLSVTFEAKDPGAFYKKIRVKSNALNGECVLSVQGTVR